MRVRVSLHLPVPASSHWFAVSHAVASKAIGKSCVPCEFVGGLLFDGIKTIAGGGGAADKSSWQQYKLTKSLKTSQDYLACVTKVCNVAC